MSSDRKSTTIPTEKTIVVNERQHHHIHTWALTFLLCLFSVICFVMAFPPYDYWFCILFSPALLSIAAISAMSTVRVVIAAVISHFMLWMWLHRWLVDVTAVGWPLLALYLSVYAGLFVWIIRRYERKCKRNYLPYTMLLPIFWVFLEQIRSEFFMYGYPWYQIGHPLIEAPVLVQVADITGAHGISILVALLSGLFVDLYLFGKGRCSRKAILVNTFCIIVLFTANIAYGIFRLGQEEYLKPGPTVMAVQTNLELSNKQRWDKERQKIDVEKFIQQTADAFNTSTKEIDLIVWPETMVPGLSFEPENIKFHIENRLEGDPWLERMESMRDMLGVPLVLGNSCKIHLRIDIVDGKPRYGWGEAYNSAYLLDVGGEAPYQRYDKIFLTPFGETMPYISKWDWLENQLASFGPENMKFDLDEGKEIKRLSFKSKNGQITIATPICFEDTVASVCRKMVWKDGKKQAVLLVNLSNDGWFGKSIDGRLQHAQIARFRCIENRVPMIRAVNTGMSVYIDSYGKIILPTPQDRKDYLRQSATLIAEVNLDERAPIYSRIGDFISRIFLFAGLILAGATFWKSSKATEI